MIDNTFSLDTRQQAQCCSRQFLACSCLHIGQTHRFDIIFANALCFFDFSSAYNHNMTTGIPITKKTIIVLIGTRITKREMAKHTVPIPIINNQRRMMSMSPDST